MDLQSVTNWLKTTILGILTLGALGSIIAVFLLKFFKQLFRRWLPNSLKAYLRYEYLTGYKHGWTFQSLINKEHVIGAIVYCTFHGLRMILALFTTVFFFQFFLITISLGSDILLTIGTYSLVFMAFICLRWVFFEYRHISLAYKTEIKPLMDEAIDHKKQKEDTSLTVKSDNK